MTFGSLTDKFASLNSSSSCSSPKSVDSPSSSVSSLSVENTFEGPEKNLEIDFDPSVGHPEGCRAISRTQLNEMLDAAKCQILSQISNAYLDAYVLSESSLFVYKHKIVIKTCGTTTLLKCLPFIQKYAIEQLGLRFAWMCYSRTNYIFPDRQLYPHTSFQSEVDYLNKFVSPKGTGYILGPITHDHWFTYVWDNSDRPSEEEDDRTLHLLMHNMHPDVAEMFFKNPDENSQQMTEKSGINKLLPGATIDDFAFDPCGYSMNGILFDSYYTIHITPESECSYVSFETNAKLSSYESLVRNVLKIFRPEKFTMTLYADSAGLRKLKSESKILPGHSIGLGPVGCYKRKGLTKTDFEGDYICAMSNYTLK